MTLNFVMPDPSSLGFLNDALLVLLGALVAFASTWWFSHREERERRRGTGYAIVLRVNEATQTILQIRKMLTKNLGEVGPPEVPYKWLVAEIPAGFAWRADMSFPPEELAIFARAERNEVLIQLGELARLHNIVISAAAEYAKRRETLQDRFQAASQTEVVVGTQVRSAITAEALAPLRPQIAMVENLLEQLLQRLNEGGEFAVALARKIGPEVRSALKDKRFNLGLAFDVDPLGRH